MLFAKGQIQHPNQKSFIIKIIEMNNNGTKCTPIKNNKMEQIAKAIIKVMQEVKGMEKNSRVGSGGSQYNGTKDMDVKEVFNQALSDNGLCILPIGIEEETRVDRWQEVDQWSKETPKAMKQKQTILTKVKTKYMLLHTSGEHIELAGYGHGVDPQDKGAGKATTYALKNCLLYTFLTPVGKIDDTETTHSKEIEVPKQNVVILPNLTDDQFESAQKGTKAQINTVLKKYNLTTIQEKGLQIALTTAK